MRYRAVGAVLALATVPFGLVFAVAQMAVLIVLLVAMLYVEAYSPGGSLSTTPTTPAPPPG